jgi:2-hydroxy-3-oxopropionate reductase
MQKVGFIGLGIMGKPMSKNLLKAGHALVVHSRSPGPVEELVAAGATAAASPRDVAQAVDVIITMLPDSPDVRQVVLGTNGVIEGARPGAVVVDMSSIAPAVSREIAARLAEKGVDFLDAPVSGGELKAIAGTLAVMAGGSQKTFDACVSLLKCMAASVVRVGGVGAGNVAKLANQVIAAINIAAISEALVLAAKAGADPALVYEAIRGGLAGSALLDAKVPAMLDRRFIPGFKLRLHIKDLANALDAGREFGSPLPLTAAIKQMLQGLQADGLGEADHSALLRHFEKLAGIEVNRGGTAMPSKLNKSPL